MRRVIDVPKPTRNEVLKYLARWDSLENYVMQENSINILFSDLVPENSKLENILLKSSVLNDFYSTNIFSIFPVAKRILSLNIDERLKSGDPELVNEIKIVEIGGKTKTFYSFATKYCSHHNPFDFPIYDSYVEKVLWHFKNIDEFSNFARQDLKDYLVFKRVLVDFKKYYGIDEFNLKDIDRYLWQLGKLFFPNNYGESKK